MYWSGDTDKPEVYQVPEDIVDLSFRIRCKAVRNDHAWALSQALRERLPWLHEAMSGIHLIHGAESGNGWLRPLEPDALIHLSRRARLVLRLANERIADARKLEGETLAVGDAVIEIDSASVRLLSTYDVQFARYVLGDADETEEHFLTRVADELQAMAIKPRKLLCGKSQILESPDGDLHARSLMVADLEPEEAVRLQQRGIGAGRLLGCGLFVAHKGIKAV